VRIFLPQIEATRRLLQTAGPYLLLELLLPGGTLFALLLFLYRRKGSRLAAIVQRFALPRYVRALRAAAGKVMLPLDVYRLTRNIEAAQCKDDGLDVMAIAPGRVARCVRPSRGRMPRYTRTSEIIAVH
jgi:hypothetical protein